MAKLTARLDAFLSRRGGTWPNYFRRTTWYSIPFVLMYNLISDVVSIHSDASSTFLQSMLIPLGVTGSFLLLAQTAATLGGNKHDESKEAFDSIALNAFAISIYALPVGWILMTCVKLFSNEPNNWTYFMAPFYVPAVIGCIYSVGDIYNSLEAIKQECIRLRLFDAERG